MGDTILDRLRDIVLFIAGAIAIVSLILALYEGFNQRVLSASFLAGLFIACSFVVFFPKLEVLKAFGIEGRLARTLDRAEEILAKLRRLSLISARSSYTTLAWNNRWGGISAKDKQAILDEVDKQLSELNVTAEERKVVVGPYVRLIGWDFYQMYIGTLARYMESTRKDDLNKVVGGNADPTLREKVERFSSLLNNWRAKVYQDGLFTKATESENGLGSLLDEAYPDELLEQRDREALKKYRAELEALFKGCAIKGGLTAEAAEYYDRYHDLGGFDRKIIELFDYNPSAVR